MEDRKYPAAEFLSKNHAAQWADVSLRTIDRWISSGLPTYQWHPRSKVLVKPSDIQRFLTRYQRPAPTLNALVEETIKKLAASNHRSGRSSSFTSPSAPPER